MKANIPRISEERRELPPQQSPALNFVQSTLLELFASCASHFVTVLSIQVLHSGFGRNGQHDRLSCPVCPVSPTDATGAVIAKPPFDIAIGHSVTLACFYARTNRTGFSLKQAGQAVEDDCTMRRCSLQQTRTRASTSVRQNVGSVLRRLVAEEPVFFRQVKLRKRAMAYEV